MQQLHAVMNRVTFIDGVDYERLPSEITDCEIVLLPSLFESFSYTCAEAMAAGKAVAGSRNGGMSDLIENGKSGALVDPESYHEIYLALKKMIDDHEFRYEISVNARERILTEFNASDSASRFNTYYNNILKGVAKKRYRYIIFITEVAEEFCQSSGTY